MSTKTSTPAHEAFIKDASSYIAPVLIVLAAMFLSMGNLFSVHAEEPTVSASPEVSMSIPEDPITISGTAGYTVSGSGGYSVVEEVTPDNK